MVMLAHQFKHKMNSDDDHEPEETQEYAEDYSKNDVEHLEGSALIVVYYPCVSRAQTFIAQLEHQS
jgi:hypothetical protein